ncbi:uncharacterized protein Dana_GF27347 [Drosophila ananassae]|uniref:Phenoloxidase-activating factor 2 n=1 Tax=Drosophila ananassae TaxID=7217 RepID=A0A0P8Y735_DROAN|nr:phenoloxidase-activating factor 2-like [Drosophila ananassae]KPU77202.1 uncharacterized protein Dana_GF27347 [Drosophila ananassae]
MARSNVVFMLCLVLALAVVQARRSKPCGNSSFKSCVARFRCNTGEVHKASGNLKGVFRMSNSTLECSSTQICCPNDKITNETKKTVAVPTKCGQRNPHGLTFYTESETFAQEGEFPWVVALMSLMNTYKGAGSLIADNMVLTGAYKVSGENQNSLKVRAGEWDMKTNSEQYANVDARIRRIVSHPNFEPENGNPEYNIAILLLDRPFSLTPHVYPICLPSPERSFDLARCITNGWGQEKFEVGINAHVMKKVEVPMVPGRICEQKISRAIGSPFSLHESLLCAGGEKGKDSCLGDGGGPLACPLLDDPSRFELAGIVNWGVDCGLENMPAVYTNVANMRPWIDEIMDDLATKKPPTPRPPRKRPIPIETTTNKIIFVAPPTPPPPENPTTEPTDEKDNGNGSSEEDDIVFDNS